MKVLKIIGLIIGCFVAFFFFAIAFQGISDFFATRRTTITFDNGTANAVIVRVDGQEIGTAPAYNLLKTDKIAKPGMHKVEIVGSNGKPLESQDAEIKDTGLKVRDFVYNIQGANHYAVYTIGYGSAKVASPRKPLPDARFFEVMSAGATLGEGFPKTVKVRQGTGGTTYSVLGHNPMHKDRKCCQALRESLK